MTSNIPFYEAASNEIEIFEQAWKNRLPLLIKGPTGVGKTRFVAHMAARLGLPFTIEMLMSVAALGAVVIGAAEEAAAVVFLFLVGELLEGVAAGRARAGIRRRDHALGREAVALFATDAVYRQLVMRHFADTLIIRPAQHLHHIAHAKALIHAVNSRERLTRIH